MVSILDKMLENRLKKPIPYTTHCTIAANELERQKEAKNFFPSTAIELCRTSTAVAQIGARIL